MRLQHFSFVLVMVFGLLTFCFTPSVYAAESEVIGQVVWANGSVQAIGSDNAARTLTRRSPIFEHDTIVTSGSGTGQIVFTDNSAVTLRAGTTLKIDEYKFNPSSPSDGKYVANLAKGGFRTITGYISKGNPEGYQVNTPVATIGVRGTDYTVFYSAIKGLAAAINSGAITLSNSAGHVDLTAGTTQAFAQVTTVNNAPQLLNTKPKVLVPLSINSSTPPAPGTKATPGGTIPGTQNVTPTGGPSKNVSGFCVGG